MKKVITVMSVAVLAVILLLVSSCSKKAPAQPSHQLLKIGVDDQFPPMGFSNNGAPQGFSIDMAAEAIRRMSTGYGIEFQIIDWNSKEQALQDGKVDLLWNDLTITETLKRSMLLSKPYLRSKLAVMVSSKLGITDTERFLDYVKSKGTIGVPDTLSAMDAVKKQIPNAKIVEYPYNMQAFKDLRSGVIEAIVTDEKFIDYWLANTDKEFYLLKMDLGQVEYAVGMRFGEEKLAAELEWALDSMSNDGTVEEISKKWFSSAPDGAK